MDELQWKEIGIGYYERAQDTREKMILQLVNAFPNAVAGFITVAVRLDYDEEDFDPSESIREAWIALQNEHPSIASFAKADKMIYQAMDETSLQQWVRETLIIDNSGYTKEDKYEHLKGKRHAVLCFLPKTKELLFQATHELVDAIGMIIFLNNLCEYLANPWKPSERTLIQRLSPALASAASISRISADDRAKCEKIVTEWSCKSSGELITVGNVLPGPPTLDFKVQQMMLSTEETAYVKTVSKDQGFSVAHRTHAAMIIAAKIHGNNANGSWVAGMPFNARDQCFPPFNTKEYPIAPYFVSVPCSVDHPKDLLDASNQVKHIFQNYASTKRNSLEMLESFSKMMPAKGSVSRRVLPPALPILSNLGLISKVLNEEYGQLKVVSVWVAMHQMLPVIDVFCTTFRGQMCLSASYNGGYHTDKSVSSFLSILKSVLLDKR